MQVGRRRGSRQRHATWTHSLILDSIILKPECEGEHNTTAAQYAERQGCLDMMDLLVELGGESDNDMDIEIANRRFTSAT